MNFEQHLKSIQDEKIKELTNKAFCQNGEFQTDAVNVADWVDFVLTNDKLIAENSHALFVDVLKSAALLHNLTYSYGKDEFDEVFKTRKILFELNKSINIPETYLESICQTIEGQLGKDHPMVLLIPNPNTPGAHFSLACSIYYKTGSTINK